MPGQSDGGWRSTDRGRKELLAILESSEDAIFSKDLDGLITGWNDGAERLFGYRAEEAIGQPVTLLIPADRHEEEQRVQVRLCSGQRVATYETVRRRKDGSLVDVSLTVSPVRDAAGNIVGAAKIVRDMTERKQAERALAQRMREQEALYRFTDRLYRARSLAEVHTAAMDAISEALGCDRASILLCDDAGVMKFAAWRNLSDGYRRAVEGHAPWVRDVGEPQPICVSDIDGADEPESLKRVVREEGIRGLACIPLSANGSLIGKFMTCYNRPHAFAPIEIDLALTIARQLGFGVQRLRAEELRRIADQKFDRERELLQTIIDRIPVMMTMCEPDAKVLRLNPAFEHTVGWSRQEAAGESLMEQCYPDPAYRAKIASFMESNLDAWMDIRMRTKDGRDIETTWSNIRLSDGSRVGIGIDITERKHAEKLQKLLVSELNHRVRNTLATVQAIASQTVRSTKSPHEFAANFSGRLQAIARTHTLLTDNTWQGADVRSLIRVQLLLDIAEDERISYCGPAVRLDPQPALHLALMLHELGTNGRKHGALSVSNGRLSVRWQLRTNGSEQLILEWKERHGPPVNTPTTLGFGTTLIEQSLEAYGGGARLAYDAEGVTCEIHLPVHKGKTAPPEAGASLSRHATGASLAEASMSEAVRGTRVLVVDDEPLVAMDVAGILVEAGCEVLGPAGTLSAAKALISRSEFDIALLDANLGGQPVDELAAAVADRKIPFAFLTGYAREGLPQAFRNAPMIGKPFTRKQIVDVLRLLAVRRSP
jgi:PAS domain S-box-containing protein